MRIYLPIFLLVLIAGNGFSQGPDTRQLPIIYKQNNVKSRISDGYMKIVDHFDRNGLLIRTVSSDRLEKIYVYTEKFEYDSNQNLIKDTYFMSTHTDSTKKEIGWINRSIEHKLEHDSIHRLTKIIYLDTVGNPCANVVYTYDPYVKTLTSYYWKFDSTVTVTKYDDHSQEINFSSTTYLKNGEVKYSSFMEYKNSYDKAGRIKKRKVKTSFTPFDSEATYPLLYPAKYEYTYLRNGLLSEIEITSVGGRENKQSFEYQYWQ